MIAFSSEVGDGSREENALKQHARAFSSEVGTGSRGEKRVRTKKSQPGSDSIGTDKARL
jgi:hypothetical protein